MRTRRASAFTLVELLVVVALIAAVAIAMVGAAGGGRRSVALETAQGTLANAVALARTRAVASGGTVRVLVHNSPQSPLAHERYRRLIVMVEEAGGDWRAVDGFKLPDGVYLLPYRTRVPTGMFAVPADWRTANNQQALGSSALAGAPMEFSYDAEMVESWEWLAFTPRGTVDGAGSLIAATGRERGPSEAGSSMVELVDPENVRGVMLSNYGVPRLLNDRSGF